MHQDRISGDPPDDERSTNADEDFKWQGAVLGYLLSQYPHQLTEREIIRAMAGERPTYDQKDAIERAIEEIVRAGIARRCESLVLLTHTARRIFELEVG
jgi:hypothetical protein